MIILLISRSGHVGQVGQFCSGTGGHEGKRRISPNENRSLGDVVWRGVLWSGPVWSGLVLYAKIARMNWFPYI